MSEVKIQARENGPLIVSGAITLLDREGQAYDLGGKESVALCRCGGSGNSPFCDGSHKTCGFQASDSAPVG